MIKKYGIGLLAAGIATLMVAFTQPEKAVFPIDTSTFYYVPPTNGDYSEASVETESNWTTAPDSIPSCVATPNKACRIVVDNINTTGSGSSRALNFSLNAIAGAGGPSNGYVPDLSATPEISSKVDKP